MRPNSSDDRPVGPRQAVVLIHGIGEQRPMATLRAFVEWLLPAHDKKHDYYSKPDQISDSFELRRIKLKRLRAVEPSEQSLNLDWPETDFYEYYWAHRMHGTTISHVVRWLVLISKTTWRHRKSEELGWLFRPGCRGPLTVLGLAALIALAGGFALVQWLGALGAASLAVALGVAWKIVRMVANIALLDVVGDAARYLDVNPSNVARRYDILRDGVSMLRKFHEDHDELRGEIRYRYGRVVLVGHSLGSVIAYDIIRHYWADVNGKLRIEGRSAELLNAVAGYYPPPKAGCAPPHSHDPIRFRQAQSHAWSSINGTTPAAKTLPSTGFPHPRWLVSDLVTLGSPLAYARLLLADGRAELDAKVRLRELPTCPPDRSTTVNKGYYTVPLSAEAVPMEDDYPIIHHAAPFALTRWTNFHLKNDPLGYRLRGVLGQGIRDISIDDPDGPCMFKAHTSYWLVGERDRAWKNTVRDQMLSILKEPESRRC
jgi:hypothetical protein